MEHFLIPGKKLGNYLATKKQSQRSFADQVGCRQSVISRIVTGKIRPGIDLAHAIEAETNGSVKASSWVARSLQSRRAAP